MRRGVLAVDAHDGCRRTHSVNLDNELFGIASATATISPSWKKFRWRGALVRGRGYFLRVGSLRGGVDVKESRGPYAKSAIRRDAILDAALKVFAASGYWSGSLEEIATAVGVTKPALRYYFPSKEALFTGVLERWDVLAFVVSPLDQEDPVEALRGLVRLTERNLEIPGVIALHTMTSIEATNEQHPAHEFYVQRYDFFRRRITEILERCEQLDLLAPGVEPARAARTLGAVMDGLQMQWLTDPESVDLLGDITHHIGGLLAPGAHWERRVRLSEQCA